MLDFFRAYKADGTTIPAYFIESTAPENVDDRVEPPPPLPPILKPIPADEAIKEIARELATASDPNLVVMVHGFNNPEPDVLRMYTGATMAVEADGAIRGRRGLVCIGYRWPSEKMGTPFRGSWDALPTLPTWILYIGLAITAVAHLCFHFFAWGSVSEWGNHLVTLLGWTLAGLILMTVLLRAIVYFRDTYRASNYGVPDLVHIIRVIDGEIVRLRGQDAKPGAARSEDAAQADSHDVQLSFIGHSMGGFVVTNTIRVLSDLFEASVHSLNMFGAAAFVEGRSASPHIGHVFRLKRFVLASPDIPAETLLENRGNFLASSLLRFDEAYLFCNEGDEVLRQISTLANYFVFPTRSRDHGFRLGNVEILSRNFGMIRVADADYLGALRVGRLTLQELYDQLEEARAARHGTVRSGATTPPGSGRLPRVFTYFDCTDYIDHDRDGGKIRPLLTFALWDKRHDAAGRMRWYQHFLLLLSYIFRHQRPNVHGGYFEGVLSQQLMYRLACLGFDSTVAAFGGEASMSKECAQRQIRALVSPLLHTKTAAAPPPAAPPATTPGAPAPTAAGAFVVPDVERRPIEEARRIIDAVRGAYVASVPGPMPGSRPQLVVLEVTEQSEAPAGTVLRQAPPPGTRVVAGTPIELVVAKR
jgi:hypothetical protein